MKWMQMLVCTIARAIVGNYCQSRRALAWYHITMTMAESSCMEGEIGVAVVNHPSPTLSEAVLRLKLDAAMTCWQASPDMLMIVNVPRL